jgi:hypothetical protein
VPKKRNSTVNSDLDKEITGRFLVKRYLDKKPVMAKIKRTWDQDRNKNFLSTI